MAKVLYNGKYIELCDELEPGLEELDLLTGVEQEGDNLENTIQLVSSALEDTAEINIENLENTQELDLGDINE